MTTAPLFPVAFFQNKSDAKPQPQGKTWAEFVQMFKRPAIRADKDGPLFSPARFTNGRRLNENVQSLSMLVLDFDHNAALAEALETCEGLGCDYLIYTTHSHRRVTDKHPVAEDCFRVVFPLREPIPPEDFPRLFKWAEMIFDHKIDKTPKGVAWMYYLPAAHSAESPYEIFAKTDGDFLDWRVGADSQTNVGGCSATLRFASPPHTPQTDAEERDVRMPSTGSTKKRPSSSSSASVSVADVSLANITYDPSDEWQTWKACLIVHLSKHPKARMISGKVNVPGICHGSREGSAVFGDTAGKLPTPAPPLVDNI